MILASDFINWRVTPHVVSIVVITIGLVILFTVIGKKIKKADPLKKPKGILLLTEIFVSMIDKFTLEMAGEKLKSLSPYIGFLAVYLFTANVIGLLGLTPPTSSLSVTFMFGITTFILIRYYGIKYKGKEHFTGLFKPLLFSPMNIIGELTLPVSLSVRLFGNILSGVIIMALIYGGIGLLTPYLELFTGFTFIVPLFHAYFDIFSGLVQTLVFVLLTTVFVSLATE